MSKFNALICAGEVLRPKNEKRVCPRYESCNANICPLDPEWHKRKNLKEDATCFYLSESVKHGAKALFDERGLGYLFERIEAIAPAICSKHARIRNALNRAKESGSRIAKGLELKKGAGHVL